MRGSRLLLLTTGLAMIASACAAPADPQPQTVVPTSRLGADRSDVLLYAGSGSWEQEVDSITQLLYARGATYHQAGSEEINAMPAAELARFRAIIVPGGSSEQILSHLGPESKARLRDAVQRDGLGYVGFCAGAWIAVAPNPDEPLSYGLGLVAGAILKPLPMSQTFAIVNAELAHGRRQEMLWYGGPITPNLPGSVVAKYPGGEPAITQLQSGRGRLILSGLHPAASTKLIASMDLNDPDGADHEFAWAMLDAAIRGVELPVL